MPEKAVITLTTDFGLKDPFVGIMKGVILGINPDASIVDLTHNIERHNIFEASQSLKMSCKYFPPFSIHLVVVDPGVGGSRRPVLAVTENAYFVGPDNGVLTSVIESCATDILKVFHITASRYFLPMSGSTFHGRDIFAPVAAWLSTGTSPDTFGDLISDYRVIPIPKAVKTGHRLSGEIVALDNFGNAISNITINQLEELSSLESKELFRVTCRDEQLRLVSFYSENQSSQPAAIINSFGYLELFAFKDNAAEKYNIKPGDGLSVSVKHTS